ncbi:GIY-YIG nuclease family protein [Cryobacterium fucosi]|uniref:GIY-YIG nuclease family protein n=1 Tax=Cryobacterium fucosi TaxID=1259157 RepID=A0A4R9B2J8_9MICO|nr:GIY-YIG nuclease family protein [Cryobacterium fucosi]TFD74713.1 GIY-YIG nuclease family protein [Cryobacterium fucosi]
MGEGPGFGAGVVSAGAVVVCVVGVGEAAADDSGECVGDDGRRVWRRVRADGGGDSVNEAKCFMYQVFDTDERLVYVGIADNFERRWQQHVSMSWWLGEIAVQRIEVWGYRSRFEARLVEAFMINVHHPIYNINKEESSYRSWSQRLEEHALSGKSTDSCWIGEIVSFRDIEPVVR